MKCDCPNCNNKSVALVIYKKTNDSIERKNDFKELRLHIGTEGRKLHLCAQHWETALNKFLCLIDAHAKQRSSSAKAELQIGAS